MPMLQRWDPLSELDVVERRMRRLAESFGLIPTAMPAADVLETNEEILVELDVPGYDEHELSVTVTDHTLAVVGDRQKEASKTERALRVHERLEAHFERRFQLPAEADGDQVRAEYAKGVLTVHVPKPADARPRSVPIEMH